MGRVRVLALSAALVCMLLAGAPLATAQQRTMLHLLDFEFIPQTLEVSAGGSFVVMNLGPANASTAPEERARHVHSVTSAEAGFDLDALAPDYEEHLVTAPSMPGSYPIHCRYHENMTGTLVVLAAEGASDAQKPAPASGLLWLIAVGAAVALALPRARTR